MKIAVLGATGTAGRHVTAAAQRAGHETVALSRATGVDVHTGEGLAGSMSGSDVVIDVSNPFPTAPDADLIEVFVAASARVAQAAQAAGVQHLVHMSICNIDNPAFDDYPYFLAKRAQEKAVRDSGVSCSIVRSAQWYEYAMNPGAVTEHADRVEVEDWLIQPIAAASVAEVLVETALDRRPWREVAGPAPVRLPELTGLYLDAIGDPRTVVPAPPAVPELADGILLAPEDAELHGPDAPAWATNLRR